MFKIRCECSGGMLGYRVAFLKGDDGQEKTFETFEEADNEAKRITKQMNVGRSMASFRYQAVESYY